MKEHQQQYGPWHEIDKREEKTPIMTKEESAAAAAKAAQAMARRQNTQEK